MIASLLKLGTNWIEQQKPVNIYSEKCSHSRHKAASCTACTEVCPHDAIEISNQSVNIDWNCTGCGLCISVCPTEALQLKEQINKEYYTQIKEITEGKGTVDFFCEVGEKKIHNHILNGTIKVNCLGQIENTAIALAISQGVNTFNFQVAFCKECNLEDGYRIFETRFKKWKLSWPNVEFNQIDKKIEQWNKRDIQGLDVCDASNIEDKINRRDFFKVFGSETKQVVVDSMLQKREESPWKNGELIPQSSIRLQVYQKWIKQKLGLKGFIHDTVYHINEDLCTSCYICEKVCPTGSISIPNLNESGKINWNREACIDCSLCKDVCYRDAITNEI